MKGEICAMHARKPLAPTYCPDCGEVHAVCQSCGVPVHQYESHECRLSFGLSCGDVHECFCGAIITRYQDGCAVDYGTDKAHVCGKRAEPKLATKLLPRSDGAQRPAAIAPAQRGRTPREKPKWEMAVDA